MIINIDKLKELHSAGLNDGEIADQLGVKRTTVSMARKRLGLPANRKVGQHGSVGTRSGEEEEAIAFSLREQHVLAVRELSGPRVRVGNGDLLKWASNAYALDISHIEYIYSLDEKSRPADIPEKIPAVISTIEAVSYGFKKGKGGGKRALVYNVDTE
ncbi:GcrA cell cycle regulator [Thermanaeromonas toyohensis ToBE]|uniref:GcrA cell cycle regulator n=1 Tax=Thermanaeromonas toyohensis ToBE TaxID=698762 RepID=A0A1W1VRX6_9FIRM|nr:hypothetical protein [Thermanaeromonas toyohensis]SMB95970.1 GcrA cell cycle regulator [Thermanaeromonas toyohensis ToBE]